MARVDPTCALVLWDERLSVADIEPNTAAALTSSYSEGDKRPGLPVRMGRLLAQVSGDQDATVDMEVSTRGGFPGRAGCGVLASTDGGTSYLGHMPECMIRYHDILVSGASEAFDEIGGCVTSRGTPIVAVYNAIYRYSGGTWTSVYDYDPLAGGTRRGSTGVGIVEDPVSGLLIAVTHDSGALYTHHSDDDGATWKYVATQTYATTAGNRVALGATRGGLSLIIQANGTAATSTNSQARTLGSHGPRLPPEQRSGLGGRL